MSPGRQTPNRDLGQESRWPATAGEPTSGSGSPTDSGSGPSPGSTLTPVDPGYYNPAADRADRESYYGEVDLGAGKAELYQALSQLLKEAHVRKLGYSEARHEHLYPRVDLHPDGRLHSLYSGAGLDPRLQARARLSNSGRRRGWSGYSAFRASVGSTRAARRAGVKLPAVTVTSTNVPATRKVPASPG